MVLLFALGGQDNSLEKCSIKIITRIYSLRSEVLDSTKELLVLFDSPKIQIYKDAKEKLKVLGKLCEESETWLKEADEAKTKKMLTEVMRYLEELCRMLSRPNSENLSNPNVITERKFIIDKDVQEVFKNLEAQEIVIDIIRDNIWLMKDKPDKANDENFVNFFKYCFLFLMKFCHKNETNQDLLSKSISVFIQEQDFDVGQVG